MIHSITDYPEFSFPEYLIIRNEFSEIIRLFGEYYINEYMKYVFINVILNGNMLSGKFFIRMTFKKKIDSHSG